MIAEDPYYMVIKPSNTFKICLVGRQLAKWKHQLFFLIDFNFRCSIEFHQCFDRSGVVRGMENVFVGSAGTCGDVGTKYVVLFLAHT